MILKNVQNIMPVFNYEPFVLYITLKSPRFVGQGNVSLKISNNISKTVSSSKDLDENAPNKNSESEASNKSYEVALLLCSKFSLTPLLLSLGTKQEKNLLVLIFYHVFHFLLFTFFVAT